MPTSAAPQPWCSIVPDYLMRRLASADEPTVVAAAERSLRADVAMRARREQQDRIIGRLPGIVPQGLRDRARDASTPPRAQQVPTSPDTEPPTARRSLYDAEHRTSLPGRLVRSEGEPATEDISVTEAYDGLGATWGLLIESYGRDSLDGAGLPLTATVHYDKDYDNAFWDGTQMTYGDGASNLHPLTELDVAGHEMSHGVTENTAGLIYSGESGGLNEATSDIFGTAVEWYAGNAVDTPDYLIGEMINLNGNGTPLRYMDRPSKDGKSADCWSSTVGSLNVHYSSGPLNHWYYLASEGSGAKTINGVSYNSPTCNASTVTGIGHLKAERVWYRALSVCLTSSSNYAAAREASIRAAKDLYGVGSAECSSVAAAFSAINVKAGAQSCSVA